MSPNFFCRISRALENDLFGGSEFSYEGTMNQIEAFLPTVLHQGGRSFSSSRMLDPHHCVLRTICEVGQTPLTSDGIFGEMMNLVMAPDSVVWAVSATKDSDYLQAYVAGRDSQDCSAYHHQCPLSIFTVSCIIAVQSSESCYHCNNSSSFVDF